MGRGLRAAAVSGLLAAAAVFLVVAGLLLERAGADPGAGSSWRRPPDDPAG